MGASFRLAELEIDAAQLVGDVGGAREIAGRNVPAVTLAIARYAALTP